MEELQTTEQQLLSSCTGAVGTTETEVVKQIDNKIPWQNHLSTAPFWLCAVDSERGERLGRFKRAGMATSQRCPPARSKLPHQAADKHYPRWNLALPVVSMCCGEVSKLLVIIS